MEKKQVAIRINGERVTIEKSLASFTASGCIEFKAIFDI